MNFINLTPHSINVLDLNGDLVITLEPSGVVARCAATTTAVDTVNGVVLNRTTFGVVTGLPDQQDGVLLVVSMLVRAACPNRSDLSSPGELVRDQVGQPIGCKGLVIN